ncbi:MAG: hypothetical protein QOF78_3635 [Phycisphaerales bacterium]|jgi:uncharacterized protein YgiM (DUF1202 family)|nr:hypothetical protein [Phycisphaerales bacterium]
MARRFFLTAAAAVSLTLASPIFLAPSMGQVVPPPVENSRNSAECVINADNVYVRSGAGENYYPTMKLGKGTKVTVIGEKFDWLKIVPPEGSFSYVGKHYVEKTGENAGKVNRENVNVRAGSVLTVVKTTVQAQLAPGQEVKILGEADEYYKIAPPADAAVYVKKDSVEVLRVMPQVAAVAAPVATPQQPQTDGQSAPAEKPVAEVTSPGGLDQTQQPLTAENVADATTRPSDPQVASGQAAPSTQPTAEVRFDKLEADFDAASAKPIEQQPVAEMLQSYQQLIKDPQLPESMRRVADYRSQVLKVRAEARDQFVDMQKKREDSKKKIEAYQSEREEIAQQIQKTDVKIYTAVGTLRTSSIQHGTLALYRLTDPQNGRTVCYLRSEDPKYGGMIGRFIGVKGDLATDPSLGLKVVTPTEVKDVDPNELFRGVGSQIVPPSLLPQGVAQQASGNE